MTLEDVSMRPAAATDAASPGEGRVALLLIGAIVFGSMIGATLPDASAPLSAQTDPTLLALIFLLLFELRMSSLFKGFANFRFIALAWGANFLIVPVIGFSVAALLLPNQPLVFVGLMIYFLAPCTDWFLGFTRMARGDTALGAALIPINMITQLALFPVWLWVLAKTTGVVDLAAVPGLLAQWFFIPLAAAQALRLVAERVSPSAAERILDGTGRLIPLVLAVLIAQLFAANIGMFASQAEVFAVVALAVFIFFVATYFAGAAIARLGRFPYPQRALLAMTMAARNAPLALALTAAALPDQPAILAAIAFGMLIEIPHLTLLKQLLLRQHRAQL